MTQLATVDNVFAQLMSASTNPRQRESLERIKKACDYLEEQGLKVAPSAIERYCTDRDWEGPKAQSIRNSPVLRRYVELRKSGQKIAVNRHVTAAEPLIADETIRAYVRLLQEERDQAVAARNRIEAGLRSIPGVPVDDLIRVGFGGAIAPAASVSEATQISPAAAEALNRLFEPNHLANCGLQLHKERVRQAVTGNVLLEKHHVTALRALVTGTVDEKTTS